jgi:tetratricopeptide (TPR) repeat protein
MRGWENGEHEVKAPYLHLLCELYGKSADQLGLSTAPAQARSDIGLIYSPSLADAVQAIQDLATFDLQKHPGIVGGTFSEQAISAACLDWLFGYPKWDIKGDGAKVTAQDVAEIIATTEMLDSMDRQRGGDHARNLAVTYLRDNVTSRLNGSYADNVRSDLFHAASVLCEVIGYMAYDAEKHSLAQRYFTQALRLAKAAGDTGYGAFVLNTLSHQAMYLERPAEALRLAQAAAQAYRNGSVSVVNTESAMLEAKAAAQMGDRTGCARALDVAEKAFNAQDNEPAPSWAAHWSETLFSAFAGDCWLSVGDTERARPYLWTAWNGSQGQARRKVFAAGQLAKAALQDHELEDSARFALVAVESTDGLKSRRSLQVVSDLRKALASHRSSPAVRTFHDRVNHLLAG